MLRAIDSQPKLSRFGQLFLHLSRYLMQLSRAVVSTPPSPQPSRFGSMLRRRQQIIC
jgi:hypothetical protein